MAGTEGAAGAGRGATAGLSRDCRASGHGEPVMPEIPGDWARAPSGAARPSPKPRAVAATVNASDDLRLAADLSGAYSVITRPLT